MRDEKQTLKGRWREKIFGNESMGRISRRWRRRISVRKPLEAQLHARPGRDRAEGRRRRQLFVRNGELNLLPSPLWEKVDRWREAAARRMRGLSPRRKPLIRRFAPPSPTRGEGKKRRD